MIWVLGTLGTIVMLLIAHACDEYRKRLLLEKRLAAVEQRFRDGGIDLADSLATSVTMAEKWQDWDEDVPPDDRPVDREMWRD